MGRRKHRSQSKKGSQSATKADPGQKKGPGTTVGLGGPPGAESPEQEGEGAREPEVITQEHPPLTTASPSPHTPSFPSDSLSHSLSKEGDTNSVSEDTSTYASCLTEEAATPSEETPPQQSSQEGKTNDSTLNSASDTVAQISSHNGAKKDSEYESAEEVDIPLDSSPDSIPYSSSNSASIVEEQPVTGENSAVTKGYRSESTRKEVIDSSALVNQGDFCDTQVADGTAPQQEHLPPASDIPVTTTDSSVTCGAISQVDGHHSSLPVDAERECVPQIQPENLPTLISESLVTVTKSEIIEDSVSEKEVLIDERVILSPSDIQLEEKVSEVVQSDSPCADNNIPAKDKVPADPENIHVSELETDSTPENIKNKSESTSVSQAVEAESTPEDKVVEPDIIPENNLAEVENTFESKVTESEITLESKVLVDQTENIPAAKVEESVSPPESEVVKAESTPESKVPIDQTDSTPETKVVELVSPPESKADQGSELPLDQENQVTHSESISEAQPVIETGGSNQQHLEVENQGSPSEIKSDAQPIKAAEESNNSNSSLVSETTSVLPKEPEKSKEAGGVEENNQKHIDSNIDQPHVSEDIEPKREEEQPVQHLEDPGDIPIPPSKGYNLDFLDYLDDPNFNPFATKSGIRSTPPPSPDPTCKLPPLKPAVRKKDKKTTQAAQDPKAQVGEGTAENNQKPDTQSVEEDKGRLQAAPPDSNIVSSNNSESLKQPTEAENTNESLKPPEEAENSFEVELDDPVKPPRKPGKRPDPRTKKKPVSKATPVPKVVEKNNNTIESEKISDPVIKAEVEEELPIPPSKGYNLDFLDNLDDPNFNPFATKTAVRNSPPKEGFTSSSNIEEDKPKTKVVTAKKTPPKKGFAVVKTKAKAKVPDSSTKSSDTTPKQAVDSSVNKGGEDGEEDSVVVPKKGYNLDFLDDANFDPFKTRPAFGAQEAGSLKPAVNSQEVFKTEEQHTPSAKEESVSEPDLVKNKDTDKDSGIYQDLPTHTNSADECSLETEGEQLTSESDEHLKNNSEVSSELSPDVTDSPKAETEKSPDTEHVLRRECVADGRETEVVKNVNTPISENHQSEPSLESEKTENTTNKYPAEDTESDLNVHKVPSIGTIGQLDSLEFDQLLGHEASRLAEEFMNCSTDSGLPDSDESTPVKSVHPTMADTSCSNNNLDENVNPFQRSSKLSRSPPLGKRGAVCGAESSETVSRADVFLSRRSLKRENVMGEERMDTASMDDDSGIVLGVRSDLEMDANHSEAGPEIATGLTSSDLRCASQLKTEDQEEELSDHITDEEFLASEAFFKEATDMEHQFRRTLVSPLLGSHSKLSSSEEGTPTKERKEPLASVTPESPQNKPVPSTSSPARPTSSPAPPREERSAPEGTSSPTPRPTDTSERKLSSTRPTSAPPEGYMTASEVQKLLKQQELKFEEKLLQVELAAGEKEKKLQQAMKDEQKELSTLGNSVSELTQSRDALLKMVTQYKGMLASLLGEKEKEKQSYDEKIKNLETERNQALEDLANVEVAFSDVHRKYERTKQVVDTLRRNEDTLRGAVADYEAKLQKQEQKFIEFQKHAEEKIQQANEEFENMRKSNEQEMTKMAALLKKAEMKIMSLQDAFDRKTRENQELTQLCDDLINKVGK